MTLFYELKLPKENRQEIFSRCFWPGVSIVKLPTDDLANALVDIIYHECYEHNPHAIWNDEVRKRYYSDWKSCQFDFKYESIGKIWPLGPETCNKLIEMSRGVSKLYPKQTFYLHLTTVEDGIREEWKKVIDGNITESSEQEWNSI